MLLRLYLREHHQIVYDDEVISYPTVQQAITGGTAQINNLEKFIKDETNLNVNIVEHPAESVVRGLIGVVSNPEFAKVAYTPTEKNFD